MSWTRWSSGSRAVRSWKRTSGARKLGENAYLSVQIRQEIRLGRIRAKVHCGSRYRFAGLLPFSDDVVIG